MASDRKSYGIPATPTRNASSSSILTGPEIGRILSGMGVSVERFCAITGANESRVRLQITDEAQAVPLYYESVLLLLYCNPTMRVGTDPLPVPFKEWGDDDRLTSASLGIALSSMGVAVRQFARISGASVARVQRQKNGSDPDIPRWYGAVLLLLYLHPDLRHDQSPLALPYEEWGVDVEEY